MRDHDLELIAALVEGRLEDEAEARALIASSAEAREEFEVQKLAYESLRSTGSASLTAEERAALHRDVWTELRARAPVERRVPWYYRWAAVAAGLFVVIGLVSVLSGQDVATTFDEIAGDLSGDGEGAAATAGDETAADSGGDDSRAESAPTDTTEAMSEGTTTAEASDLDDTSFYETEAARVRQGEFTTYLQAYEEDEDGESEACLEQAGLIGHGPVATLTRPDPTASGLDESIVVAAPEQSVLAEAPLAFVDLATCEVVFLDEAPG